ncbi:WD40 repeat domain-containing protein, partial [Priestia megaterium]|uniref:hypothetical protein n=1 Tax=Priestia megaterium TaxID=1404 RepID=UPI0036D9B434
LEGHTEGVRTLATAVVGGRPIAVTGGWDMTVRLWDLTRGEQIDGPLEGHDDQVWTTAATLVDGRPVVITGGGDGIPLVRMWDLTTY